MLNRQPIGLSLTKSPVVRFTYTTQLSVYLNAWCMYAQCRSLYTFLSLSPSLSISFSFVFMSFYMSSISSMEFRICAFAYCFVSFAILMVHFVFVGMCTLSAFNSMIKEKLTKPILELCCNLLNLKYICVLLLM